MSIKEIAKRTGLSTATVSHALNGTRNVSEKSKKLIFVTAEKMGYKPSLAAQMLRTQKSNIIALIIPSSQPTNETNSFYFGLLNGAKEKLASLGYDMIVSTYSQTDKQVDINNIKVLQTRMVDGVLLVPPSFISQSIADLTNLDIPIVLLDRTVEGTKLPWLCSDNYNAAVGLTNLLYGGGARKIAFVGGSTEHSTVRERYRGYKDTLKKLNIAVDEQIVFTQLRDTSEEGYKVAKKLCEKNVHGVFAENSMLMIGILEYCKEKNVNVPKELSVAGFDNAQWMKVTTPTITAVQQDAGGMGEKGAAMLIDLISGKTNVQKQILMPTDVVLRESHYKNLVSQSSPSDC